MVVEENRRPIGQRNRGYAKYLTRVLAKAGVTPNFISFTSIVFAALAGACFYTSGISDGGDRVMLLIGAALFCQLRLLANMLDGMVAVEAGKGGPDGPIWNELPDRFADIFILVGAGYGVAATGMFDATLGWAAGAAAVMTAYVREVAKSAGAPADFSGPMAKPHRRSRQRRLHRLRTLAGATRLSPHGLQPHSACVESASHSLTLPPPQ
jgi:phosphatidylglycerophosphate synthase